MKKRGEGILWKFKFISPIYCNYKLFMCKRVLNRRTNRGNKYFVNVYIIIVNNKKLNITWLTKKKGTSWGILN